MSYRAVVSSLVLVGLTVLGGRTGRAAATVDPAVVGERLIRIESMMESLEVSLASQKRQIDELANAVQKLREEALQQGNRRPWADDVRRLSSAIEEVDRKRIADSEQVVKVLGDLRKAVAAGAESPKPSKATPPARSGAARSNAPAGSAAKGGESTPEKAVPYVFQEGDVLSRVVAEFNEQAKREGYTTLTTDQVMKFNGLKDAKRIPKGATIQLPLYKK